MKLSLRKIFYILFTISASALLILSGFSLFFNSELIRNQSRLIVATTIETSRFTMSNALTGLLSREQKILTLRSEETFATVPERTSLDQKFRDGLKALNDVASVQPRVLSSIHDLLAEYESLLLSDQNLITLVRSMLIARRKLEIQAQKIDASLADVQTANDNINGILMLANAKNQRQIKASLRDNSFLKSKPALDKFKIAIGQLILENSNDAQKISKNLNASLLKLAELMRQIVEETDLDNLRDLKNNRMDPLFSQIKNNIDRLSHALEDTPDLYQVAVDMGSQFNAIADQLNEKQNDNPFEINLDMFGLRLELNFAEVKLQEAIKDIYQNQLKMNETFSRLNDVASELRTNMIIQAESIAKRNRDMILCVVVLVFVFMFFCGGYLLRTMMRSINALNTAMKKIANSEESLRYRLVDSQLDEFNEVGISFNKMTAKLQFIQDHLQELVDTKTIELSSANETLEKDIERRIEMEVQVQDLNQKLVTTARRAGMADVATSVLHNVGNIANSVNVSLGILGETVSKSKLAKLIDFAPILKKYLEQCASASDNAEAHKLNPNYLDSVVHALENEHKIVSAEISSLVLNIGHIQDILAVQQSVGGTTTMAEKIFLPEAIDTAIQLCGNFKDRNITIKKEIDEQAFIVTDKSKLLQILVNLILNAKEAFSTLDIPDKTITITLKKDGQKSGFELVVQDNASGIAEENLTKIFSFGFTTKPTGHGYGLHSSALASKELGGSLQAKNVEIGRGACFVLYLPESIESSPLLS